MLSLASPEAFGRATRICSLVTNLAEVMEIEETWQMAMAAIRTEELQNLGYAPSRILDDMRAHEGWYDPEILKIADQVVDMNGSDTSVRGVTLLELRTGMELKEEVKAGSGLLLVAGQEVTVSLLERIQNYNDTVGLQLPMWVAVPAGTAPEDQDEDETQETVPNAADHEFNFS